MIFNQKELKAISLVWILESQGLPAKAVVENIDSRNILAWSGFVDGFPEALFNFARRAFQQQLPTAANLFRWKRSASPNCTLCGQETPQTNQHMLSHCSAPISPGTIHEKTQLRNKFVRSENLRRCYFVLMRRKFSFRWIEEQFVQVHPGKECQ